MAAGEDKLLMIPIGQENEFISAWSNLSAAARSNGLDSRGIFVSEWTLNILTENSRVAANGCRLNALANKIVERMRWR